MGKTKTVAVQPSTVPIEVNNDLTNKSMLPHKLLKSKKKQKINAGEIAFNIPTATISKGQNTLRNSYLKQDISTHYLN